MDYKTQLNKLSEIVNRHIANYTAKEKSIITTTDTFVLSDSPQLINIKSDDKTFDKIFSSNAPNQKAVKKQYFHYKSFDIAYKFVDEESITASALSNFSGVNDDIKEYEHFFEVTQIPYKKNFIDTQKDGLFIFCLTDDSTTEKFWIDYVGDHKGLCLEFELIDKMNQGYLYDLRKVFYDNGNQFDFYKNMQDEIFKNFNKHLPTPGLAKFGALYKRETNYHWESETRLLLNWGFYQAELSKVPFFLETYKSKKFLKMPFDNNLFTLKVRSITVGKNLDKAEKEKIQLLADKKGIKTIHP
jgi:hypothetical protein